MSVDIFKSVQAFEATVDTKEIRHNTNRNSLGEYMPGSARTVLSARLQRQRTDFVDGKTVEKNQYLGSVHIVVDLTDTQNACERADKFSLNQKFRVSITPISEEEELEEDYEKVLASQEDELISEETTGPSQEDRLLAGIEQMQAVAEITQQSLRENTAAIDKLITTIQQAAPKTVRL